MPHIENIAATPSPLKPTIDAMNTKIETILSPTRPPTRSPRRQIPVSDKKRTSSSIGTNDVEIPMSKTPTNLASNKRRLVQTERKPVKVELLAEEVISNEAKAKSARLSNGVAKKTPPLKSRLRTLKTIDYNMSTRSAKK
jgi:hypothetical protein